MNIFLPYADDIPRSIQSLDDRRLIKQILECKQLFDIALGKTIGYANHPVAIHYREYPEWIGTYAIFCCFEYHHRFGKQHKYQQYFVNHACEFRKTRKDFTPLYAEYPKTDVRCIRTTENVSALFQQKLIRKWNSDKIKPKWTNRQMPEFYKGMCK